MSVVFKGNFLGFLFFFSSNSGYLFYLIWKQFDDFSVWGVMSIFYYIASLGRGLSP